MLLSIVLLPLRSVKLLQDAASETALFKCFFKVLCGVCSSLCMKALCNTSALKILCFALAYSMLQDL